MEPAVCERLLSATTNQTPVKISTSLQRLFEDIVLCALNASKRLNRDLFNINRFGAGVDGESRRFPLDEPLQDCCAHRCGPPDRYSAVRSCAMALRADFVASRDELRVDSRLVSGGTIRDRVDMCFAVRS
jgi:hypothetical protein